MAQDFVAFGEVMMRLSPNSDDRLQTASQFDVKYGGGEYNVSASLAQFGIPAKFVTRLPNNDLGEACLRKIREIGVNPKHILRGGERLGIYFMEKGTAQRPSKVVYDRSNSSFASLEKGTINWSEVFDNAGWFHFTGITPAVSENAAQVCLEALQIAREKKVKISCDLNYRKKLWGWTSKITDVMTNLVEYCDVLIANEEDAARYFNIHAPDANITGGKVSAASYQSVCEKLKDKFPKLNSVAITLRGSLSASHNTWSGVLWKDNKFYRAPVYDIFPIVDRVGGGDSFAGGLIYGLMTKKEDPQYALNFAVAASCLKHSIPGDVNCVSISEVEQLLQGDASGRVSR